MYVKYAAATMPVSGRICMQRTGQPFSQMDEDLAGGEGGGLRRRGDGVRGEGLIQFKYFILLESFISAPFSKF